MFFTCEMPQQMEQVELKRIVDSVIRLMGPSLREKGLTVVKSFTKEDLRIRANAVQLTQVMFNLIMNAAYYSPVGGEIKLELLDSREKVIVHIVDYGKGIEPGQENKVFEPFYTTKPIGEGTGLGLSVVHGIIKSYKGTITHRPNTPKGTIFTLEFPK